MKPSFLIRLAAAMSLLQAALPLPAILSALVPAASPAELLSFTAGGHALGFAPGGAYAATGTHALRVEFVGANTVRPEGTSIGASDGQTAPLGRVEYADLWDGVTLAFAADPGGIYSTEYTLEPGADPAAIRLRYNAPLALAEDGTLSIAFETGALSETAPVAWQDVDGERIPVDVSFIVDGREVGFSIGKYDPDYALTIDPTLTWNTFLGALASDRGRDIAVDGSGNVYVTGIGETSWAGPRRGYSGKDDAFVLKMDPAGAFQWVTFLGGNEDDEGRSIAVDGSGNIYVAGISSASWGSPLRAYSGGKDAFAAKLNTNGYLTWNTFLGSSVDDTGTGVAVDGGGNAFVTGGSFGEWGTPLQGHHGLEDAFVVKLNSTGAILWSTFLGHTGSDTGYGIAVDAGSNVFVAGESGGTWGSPARAFSGMFDAFAAKLDASGALSWNTFLGGADMDYGRDIAVDGDGNSYLAGISYGAWGTPVRGYTGQTDAFAAKLDGGGALSWNTFLGGSGQDSGDGIAVDGSGNAFVSGTVSASWGSPVRAYSGGHDAAVSKLNADGALAWNTFLGGAGEDYGWGASVDGGGNAYTAGHSSADWGVPASMFVGGIDILSAKIAPGGGLTWHAFLGTNDFDSGLGIAVAGGAVFVAGYSSCTWGDPLEAHHGGYRDAFVARLDPSTGERVWHTFVGSAGDDRGLGIAAVGNDIVIAGVSDATWGSPVRPKTGAGIADAFAARLDPSGAVVWNTFLGGTGYDEGVGIAVSGNVLAVTGRGNTSWGSPMRAFTGGVDAFVAALDPDTGALAWNTFLGGSGNDTGTAVAVDGEGNVYAAGTSGASWDSPVRGYTAGDDAFVAKLDSSGNLAWNTFLGESSADSALGIVVDDGHALVAGKSEAGWGDPVRSHTAGSDAFAAKLDPAGTLEWNTFLGGSGYDEGRNLVVDAYGIVYLAGFSNATWGSPDNPYAANFDAFIAKVDIPTGEMSWNTFLGGSSWDEVWSIAADGAGNVLVVGTSNDTWGSPANGFEGESDLFAAKVDAGPPGEFYKTAPVNNSFAPTAPTLSWSVSSGAADYEYCYDTTDNDSCDSSWISAGTSGSAGLSGLANNVAYYWQVRAVSDETTYADSGAWWSFTSRRQTFADVPIDHPFWESIEAFYNAGITTGCGVSPLIFCPDGNVTRAAMAVFLLRAEHGAGYAPPAVRHFFADLPVAGKEWQEAWVDQFYSEGITTGCGVSPLIYCPEQNVTRAAMAVFILRTLYGAGYAPPAAGHYFADLPVAGKEWMEPWVDQFYREGITTGCGTGPLIYCPESSVKRQAMAAFIVRAFNLPLP